MNKRKLIYICHPISGKVKKNLNSVRAIARDMSLTSGGNRIPFFPYDFYCFILNNRSMTERKLGMLNNKCFFERQLFDELWVYGDKVTKRMATELRWCSKYHIPVYGGDSAGSKALAEYEHEETKKRMNLLRTLKGDTR